MRIARAAATAGRMAIDREGVERVSSLNEPPAPAAAHHKWTKQAPTPAPKAKPTATRRPPGPPAAILPDHQQMADLAALLNQYRADSAFGAALVALADGLLLEHGAATDALARDRDWESAVRALHLDERYTTALADFMAAWKLDLLPVIDDEPAGQQVRQSWLTPLFLGWRDGERPTDGHVEGFGGGIFAGVEVPHLREADGAGWVRGCTSRPERGQGDRQGQEEVGNVYFPE